jgi:hypothetical protein
MDQIGANIPKGGTTTNAQDYNMKSLGQDVAHNTMPPYRALFKIKRTARIYFTTPL